MPSVDDDLAGLNGDEWRDLKQCASRLEKALMTGNTLVDLNQFLPSGESRHRRAVLIELIKTEIEARYVRGQRCLLEEYLERFTELGEASTLPASLIYEEYRARWVYADRPGLDTYRDRFPNQFETLRELVQKNPLPPAKSPSNTVPPRGTIRMDESKDSKPSKRRFDEGSSILQQLIGFEKLQLLGRGEFGEVWKALAPGGVEVALKFILRTLDHDATRRELKALEKIRQLHHPFLLQTHSFGILDGKLTIVMELADGSLADRSKQYKAEWTATVPRADLVIYFQQAAEALDYLQSQHVSHRDIKPHNLLYMQGFAKVADFGMARGQDKALDEASMLCGTPHYMAPEVWRQQISRHSDQYSLAATYVQMRLGRPMFQGGFLDIFQQHLDAEPQLDPIPYAEQVVLKRALAKDPNKRYPSCVAFAQALHEVTMPSLTTQALPTRRRAGAILVSALALAPLAVHYGSVALERLSPRNKQEPPAIWLPAGWNPVNANDTVEDRSGKRFYRKLVRDVGGQSVVMVVVPRNATDDPATFYIMENKVWNDLYAVFAADSRSDALFRKYSLRPGCENLIAKEPIWQRGALSYELNPDPDMPPFPGVEGDKGKLPVFRLKVTEAHCFAEWLGGLLPRSRQWLKAIGALNDEDPRLGPIDGDLLNLKGLALKLGNGAWPVDRGDRDVSVYGCRQMASNGLEWTRDIQDEPATIPLESMLLPLRVFKFGQSYLKEALTFKALQLPRAAVVTDSDFQTSFRVILEE